MSTVVVVGSVNVDFFVRVTRLPVPGETVLGGEHWRAQGGKGANQAVAARRVGADVALVGAVGSDDLGSSALAALNSEAIDTRWLRRVEGDTTGVALIMVDAAGENLIAVASGANARLAPADVEGAIDALRPSVVLANLEVPDESVIAAARSAARAGATFVLNPAPFRPLSTELLSLVDVLTPNEHEAADLLGRDGGPWDDLYELLSECGLKQLVVTLGDRGAQMLSAHGGTRLPAQPVRAIDATGAGDAFNGVLAASLAEGMASEESVRQAVAAGTLATLQRGARAGMPTRSQLLDFLKKAPVTRSSP